jgi:hypothetical protein
VEPAVASPSCPSCGAESPVAAARCARCGFAFFEAAGRRRLPRPGGRALGAAAAVAAVVLAAVLLATRDRPPAPPDPVSAARAERQLERRFSPAPDGHTAMVRCPTPIEPDRVTRCELRYGAGTARAILVRLSLGGDLEADIPNPATLRR